MKQASLDRIRRLNKAFTNKLLIHIAGKRFGHFAVLEHVGRKSGRAYRIPIIAEPVRDGFMIALTYGRQVDWYANVAAAGGCRLRWKNRDYRLVRPVFVDPPAGLAAFPAAFRLGLKAMGVRDFLQLDIQA